MDIVLYIMLILAVVFIGGVVYMFYKDGKKEKEKPQTKEKSKGNKDNNSKQTSKKSKKDEAIVQDSQGLLEFEGIQPVSEDVALIRKNSSTYIGVLEIGGINFNLLSDVERISLEDSFAELLNGLDYPLQLFVQSKKIDLDNYINDYKNQVDTMAKELKVLQDRQVGTTGNEHKELEVTIVRKQNQVTYGYKLLDYFIAKTEKSNLLERKYYAVLKYKHNSSLFENTLSEDETLYSAYNDIYNRAVILMDTLGRNNLKARLLNGTDLSEFIYSCYNKDDSSNLKFRNVMKSKYDSLCTTATPIELKYIDNAIAKVTELKKNVDQKVKEDLEKEKVEE